MVGVRRMVRIAIFPFVLVWRIIRIAIFPAACLLTILALVLACLSFEGRRNWDRTKKELLAKGEKLSLAEFIPPPIPDEQNFFADPLWMELTDLVEQPHPAGFKSAAPRLPEGQRQIDGLVLLLLTDAERQSLEAKFPEFAPIDASKQQFSVARKPWLEIEKKTPQERKRAAEFALSVLAYSEPVISRIEQLGQRPGARFPANYEDGFNIEFDQHLSYLMMAGQVLSMRARAELELGRTEAFRRDTLTTWRLAKTARGEPRLISFLVEMTMDGIGLALINLGVKTHSWTDSDLSDFEQALAPLDLVQSMSPALRSERGFFNQFFETLSRGNKASWYILGRPQLKDPAEISKPLPAPLFWIYRHVLLAGDQAFYNRAIQRWVDAIDQAPQRGMNARQLSRIDDGLMNSGLQKYRHPFSSLTLLSAFNVTLSAFNGYIKTAALRQTEINQTRIACALERSRLKHGVYPESLDALVPEYFSSLPVDVITLQPMHYRRTEPDKFLLWSVGWNETDEGGQVGQKHGDYVWGEFNRWD